MSTKPNSDISGGRLPISSFSNDLASGIQISGGSSIVFQKDLLDAAKNAGENLDNVIRDKNFVFSMLGGRVALRLIRMFMEWAKANGADELNIHATSDIEPEQFDKFLRRLGFKPYGGNYSVRLG